MFHPVYLYVIEQVRKELLERKLVIITTAYTLVKNRTFFAFQSPGLCHLLDLSLANVKSGLECWRFLHNNVSRAPPCPICVVLVSLFSVSVVVCSTSYLLSFYIVFLGLLDILFVRHPLTAIT